MSYMTALWIRCAVCLVTVLGACLAQMEPIAADYRNVRGMNFIPTYRNIATLLNVASLPGQPAFNDTASAAGAWAAYDHQQTPIRQARQDLIDQLDRIHDVGFNTVRVWLSFHYYRFHPTEMHAKFQDFLLLCQSAGLHVIPVLWDADFTAPDDTSLHLLVDQGNDPKPILVMEAGLLGAAQPYAEAINLVSNVPAAFTGSANGDGVGFCLFSANVGNQAWPAYNAAGQRTQVNFAISAEGCGLFYGPQYDINTSPKTIRVRDYGPNASTSVQPAVAAIVALASAQTQSTWTPVYNYVSMPLNDPDYRGQQLLPGGDGVDRATVNQMLTDAADPTSLLSGLATQDFALTVRELRMARQIGIWSFSADATYRLSANSGLLALSPGGQPQAAWQMLGSMLNRHDKIVDIMKSNPALWYTDTVLQSQYYSLFHDVRHYWYLGGLDALYP